MLFADFFAPYSPDFENREYSYAVPANIHFFSSEGISRPFIYSLISEFDMYHQQLYYEDITQKNLIKFFVHGERHYVLGIIPTNLHFFGTEGSEPLYLFGADSRGRDIFSRILYGARISLTIGLLGTLITFVIGTLIGCISGYYGGFIDSVLMRFSELLMLIPGIYLLFALRALIPPEVSSGQMYLLIIVILSIIGWAGLARVVRGMVFSIKEKEFVLAAKVLGQSDTKIILYHILPQLSSYLVVGAFFSIPGYILGESVLSFLGLGIQEPSVSWGNMLSEATNIATLTLHPWVLFPAFFLVLTILSFNILADFFRDGLDPSYSSP